MPVYLDNSESIGNTPLIQINRITRGLKVRILAKIEGRVLLDSGERYLSTGLFQDL
jgi:cysteine synthase